MHKWSYLIVCVDTNFQIYIYTEIYIIILMNYFFIAESSFRDFFRNKQVVQLYEPIYFVKSCKGRRVILYQNFTFHKHTHYKDCIYWRCSKKKSLQCFVILKTQGDRIISITGIHDHPPPIKNLEYIDIFGDY